ncbi:PP2C family protein-serine/threonine phosphatase [Mycoplasmopsis glycophila]|uniref:Serine/threonine phosphatase stp n=1 Tax=Mycoplasmopsis glycophila TaxID=171285 RepID=A0A449AUV1_9BACT|nr:protein phosphatase 2C domain-containing protein [Mycoplasmopsis glycophila]VEU70275.1 Serine/threonine phosphatase stp [Mycoplasmopsis glycophila]
MIKFASKSFKGDYRAKNDDRVAVVTNDYGHILAVLCDGMGGHSFGDFAASNLINSLTVSFNEEYIYQDPIQSKKWITTAIEEAKRELKKAAEQDSAKIHMGTTLVAALIIPKEKRIFIFNAGDSRAYVYTNKNELIQITRDQNFGNSLVDKGIDSDNAFSHENSRYLTSAIGPNLNTTIEIYDLEAKSYENIQKILLTSDGVHEFLYHNELQHLISQDKDAEQLVEDFISRAVISQSNDNMSAIVVDFGTKEGVQNEYH